MKSLITAFLGLGVFHSQAFTYTVTSFNDSGPGSLREGVAQSNASNDATRKITFDASLHGLALILDSYIEITKPLTIEGPEFDPQHFSGSSFITIRGTSNLTQSAELNGNIFVFSAGAEGQSTIRWLWLERGHASDLGDGAQGLSDYLDGGAVHIDGAGIQVDIDQCYIKLCFARDGGAIYCRSGEVKVIDTIMDDNDAGESGGCIHASNNAKVTGTRSTFINNSGFQGGVARLTTGSEGTFRNCLFSSNRGYDSGGCLWAGGASVVTALNCTFTENNKATVNDNDFVDTQGQALYSAVTNGGSFTVTNCLIALNGDEDNQFGDVYGAFTSGGHNIISSVTGSSSFGPTGIASGLPRETDLLEISTGFYRSAAKHDYSYDSICRDAGDTTAASSLVSDIYGNPRVHGAAIDIGCVEITPRVVTNHFDQGAGSLRQALLDEVGWIEFDPTYFATPRTIMLETPLPVVENTVFIDGSTAFQLSISSEALSSSEHLFTSSPLAANHIDVQDITFGPSSGPGVMITSVGGLDSITELGRCTIRNCVRPNGTAAGGMNVYGNAVITNSTISGNSAGAVTLFGSGDLTLLNCTITENTTSSKCPGINLPDTLAARLVFGNCIISGNSSTNPSFTNRTIEVNAAFPRVTNLGHNLLSQAYGVPNQDVIAIHPQLEPLSTSGQHTFTHKLKMTSPAIDAGTAIFSDSSLAPLKDQVGETRYTQTDIGAREWVPISYSGWQALVFTTTPLPQQGLGGDPDADGVINVLEFYMGTNPNVGEPIPWSGAIENGNLVFRYPMARGRSVQSAEVEVSTNLQNWNAVLAEPQIESVMGVRNMMKVTLQANQSRRFARLSIDPSIP